MAKYRERLNLNEMSMSATLRADKKGTSYTVKKIGKKLQKHGGLKVGEKLSELARPTHIKNKKLHIQANNAAIAQEIEWREAQILEATKSHLTHEQLYALKVTIKKI